MTRFIYVDAKKRDPVIVSASTGIQVESSGDDGEGLDEFIMVGPSGNDKGLSLFETLLVVGIAVIASCTVTIVIIKILTCKKDS